jgi:peptidoglycan/xylan/chitin deacetylase (PgdA/CDA1 family)
VTERTTPILKRAVHEGHLIGNHSYSHDYENIYNSADAFMTDFNRNETLISEIVKRRSMFFPFSPAAPVILAPRQRRGEKLWMR